MNVVTQVRRGGRVLLCCTLLATGIAAGPATATAATDDAYTDTVEMAAGDNAGVAIAFSRLAFPDGADEVVLGRDDDFADAFASGGLQDSRPLLLTASGELDERTAAELARLQPRQLYLLGGSAAITPAVEASVSAMGMNVTRLHGPTRVETALAVAQTALPRATTAILARAFPAPGDDPAAMFVDAVVAGGWAAAENWPVLLTQPGPISDATAAYIEGAGITSVQVVGGRSAVAQEAAVQLEAMGVDIKRIAGPSRAETGAAVAEQRGEADRFVLVNALDPSSWAEGFAAAAYSARFNAPILPVQSGPLPATVSALLGRGGDRHGLVCAPRVPTGLCHEAAQGAGQTLRADTADDVSDGSSSSGGSGSDIDDLRSDDLDTSDDDVTDDSTDDDTGQGLGLGIPAGVSDDDSGDVVDDVVSDDSDDPAPDATDEPTTDPEPAVVVDPEPEATDEPTADPEPEPTTDPSPEPEPTTDPSPEPEPTTDPEPTADPTPDPEPTTASPSPSPSPTYTDGGGGCDGATSGTTTTMMSMGLWLPGRMRITAAACLL